MRIKCLKHSILFFFAANLGSKHHARRRSQSLCDCGQLHLAANTAAANANKSAASTNDPFTDLGFGVAVGFLANVYKPAIVNSATVDANGIVRVNQRANTAAGLMLEMHYFAYTNGKFGLGPFVEFNQDPLRLYLRLGEPRWGGSSIAPPQRMPTTIRLQQPAERGSGSALVTPRYHQLRSLAASLWMAILAPNSPNGSRLSKFAARRAIKALF